MRLHSPQLRCALLAAVALSGCVTQARDRLHGGQIPPFPREWGLVRVDARASELNWRTHNMANRRQQEDLRHQLALALEDTLNDGQKSDHLQARELTPARYRLTVSSVTQNPLWGLLPCLVYFTLFGCPLMRDTASVQLNLQVGGDLFEVRAQGTAFRGLYYNHDPIGALSLAAVTDATREALIKLQRQLRQQRSAK